MNYTVEYNNETEHYEMVYWMTLEGGHRITAEWYELKAKSLKSAVDEAEELDAMMNMPKDSMPTDAEVDAMFRYYSEISS
jgi:hypothetical protein